MTQIEVGRRISEYRRKYGLTQQKLADRLGVSNKAVSRWERGESLPDITILSDMSELFGVSIDTLLEGDVEAQCAGVSESNYYKGYRLMSVLAIVFAVLSVILGVSLIYGINAVILGTALAVVLLLVAIALLVYQIIRIRGEWSRPAMRYTFLALMMIVLSALMILPLMMSIRRTFDYNIGEYVLSTMGRYTYLDIVLCAIPICIYIWLRYERMYMHYVGGQYVERINRPIIIGDSLLVLGALFFTTINMGGTALHVVFIILGTLCAAGAITCSIMALIARHDATGIVYSLRNILLVIPVVMCFRLIDVVETGESVAYYLAANYPLWTIFSMMCGLIIVESIVFVVHERQCLSLQNGKTPTR